MYPKYYANPINGFLVTHETNVSSLVGPPSIPKKKKRYPLCTSKIVKVTPDPLPTSYLKMIETCYLQALLRTVKK